MIFKATNEQLCQIAANAVNASLPVGMGKFHYQPGKTFTPREMGDFEDECGLSFDYVQGRIVKLSLYRVSGQDGVFEMRPAIPDPEYHSWVQVYPTSRGLLESVVGVEILDS